jgi:hypothetical protein
MTRESLLHFVVANKGIHSDKGKEEFAKMQVIAFYLT